MKIPVLIPNIFDHPFTYESEINVKTKNPEFSEWKWIAPSELTQLVVDFKLSVYDKIKKELN